MAIISQRGDILVAEKLGNRISVFSPGDKKLKSFGSEGSKEGNFIHPHGVAVKDNGNILVTDYNHRIQQFSPEYKHITSVGSGHPGKNRLQFDHPLNVAIAPITKKN